MSSKSQAAGDIKKTDENEERGNWTHKMDFLLSVVGFAVGLGNVWRFPYRAYQNGGASFLIPYALTLALAGIPMFFLEMAMGQFASLGAVSVWKLSPVFKGIGWGMVLVNFVCSIYYNMIIAYTLYYLFASMTSTLPWTHCRPEWIKLGCWDRSSENATIARNETAEWCKRMQFLNQTQTEDYITNCTVKAKSPSELYWEREVLDMSPGIDIGGDSIKWQLALCLLLAWIIVFMCLIKGIKSSGKVVYVTAVFPYVVLLILLIWNVQLDGAWLGIKFYLVPDWNKLTEAKVWYSAGTQIFYSLGIAFGSLETMASYNRFRNNVYRDAVLVALINCGTSFFAGFVIFSVVGFMATKTGLPVSEVVAGGPGLAFIAYPEGLAMMPVAPLWSILFFLMLFSLGIDSQFASIEAIITAFVDEFPWLRQGIRKPIFIGVVCAVMYLMGLPQCSQRVKQMVCCGMTSNNPFVAVKRRMKDHGLLHPRRIWGLVEEPYSAGIYVFTLFDWYSAGLNVILISILELFIISWIYGVKRISSDISMMLGHPPNYYFIGCWTVVSPLVMLFLFIFSIVANTRASYGDYIFPVWADGIGWFLFAVPIAAIFVTAIFQIYSMIVNEKKDWIDLITPSEDWGPALEQHRTGRYSPLSESTPRKMASPADCFNNDAVNISISVISSSKLESVFL